MITCACGRELDLSRPSDERHFNQQFVFDEDPNNELLCGISRSPAMRAKIKAASKRVAGAILLKVFQCELGPETRFQVTWRDANKVQYCVTGDYISCDIVRQLLMFEKGMCDLHFIQAV